MNKLDGVFAANLIFLRKRANLTQLELAEKLNYSDKAVSKWERGEAVPDVSVLMDIADLFGVTLDYLVKEHKAGERPMMSEDKKAKRGLIVTMITFMGFLICEAVAYMSILTVGDPLENFIFCFAYPLPVWAITAIVFTAVWGNKKGLIIPIALLVAFLTLDAFLIIRSLSGRAFYPIFIILVPAELIVYFSFRLKGIYPEKSKKRKEK